MMASRASWEVGRVLLVPLQTAGQLKPQRGGPLFQLALGLTGSHQSSHDLPSPAAICLLNAPWGSVGSWRVPAENMPCDCVNRTNSVSPEKSLSCMDSAAENRAGRGLGF